MNNKKFRIIYIAIIPFLLGLLLLLGILQTGKLASAENNKATPTIDDPIGNRLVTEIETYKKDLKDPKLPPESRKIVEANEKFAEKQATKRADDLAHKDENWAKKQTVIAKETEQPSFPKSNEKTKQPGGPERGIHYDPGFPFINDANFINAWVEPMADDALWFLAGEQKKDRDQGVLFVYHAGNHKVDRFYLPEKSGRLTVIGIDGNKLKLSSEKGGTYFFDISTKEFFGVNGSILVMSTPTPSFTSTLPAYP
jgi:hypothetical protein